MLRPFFPFYGSKWRIAKLYGAPTPGCTVVEPFAGSASYSVFWEPQKVLLADLDPIIVGVWDYLIRSSDREILSLPILPAGASVDDFRLCQEAKWLIGFWVNRGSATPKKTFTYFSSRTEKKQLVWGEKARLRIASQVGAIKHWKVCCCDWYEVESSPDSFWFVDPPYSSGAGRHYRFNQIDFRLLSFWCRDLPKGVVCGGPGETWLPFQELVNAKTNSRSSITSRDCFSKEYICRLPLGATR